MKIAITGHTSGIGEAILDVLDLTGGIVGNGALEIRTYSRSNGWNLADANGKLLLEELVSFSPDVFFNNAWHPGIQTMLLTKLHNKWKDQHKVIVNTGSITGHVTDQVPNANNIYATDKKAMSEFCINKSFEYPYNNKCRLINFSWGFVETGLISSNDVGSEALINTVEAATLMIEHAERAWLQQDGWSQPDIIINSLYSSAELQEKTFKTAARSVAKHLIKTKKSLRRD
jgi:hypothetical protein